MNSNSGFVPSTPRMSNIPSTSIVVLFPRTRIPRSKLPWARASRHRRARFYRRTCPRTLGRLESRTGPQQLKAIRHETLYKFTRVRRRARPTTTSRNAIPPRGHGLFLRPPHVLAPILSTHPSIPFSAHNDEILSTQKTEHKGSIKTERWNSAVEDRVSSSRPAEARTFRPTHIENIRARIRNMPEIPNRQSGRGGQIISWIGEVS